MTQEPGTLRELPGDRATPLAWLCSPVIAKPSRDCGVQLIVSGTWGPGWGGGSSKDNYDGLGVQYFDDCFQHPDKKLE